MMDNILLLTDKSFSSWNHHMILFYMYMSMSMYFYISIYELEGTESTCLVERDQLLAPREEAAIEDSEPPSDVLNMLQDEA